MANKTVYPYGTDGQLPSSIGIINDLTTGGADKALSAQQGVVVGGALSSLNRRVDFLEGDIPPLPSATEVGGYINVSSPYQFKNSSTDIGAIVDISEYKGKKITIEAVNGGVGVAFLKNNTLTNNNVPSYSDTYNTPFVVSNGTSESRIILEDCKYLYYLNRVGSSSRTPDITIENVGGGIGSYIKETTITCRIGSISSGKPYLAYDTTKLALIKKRMLSDMYITLEEGDSISVDGVDEGEELLYFCYDSEFNYLGYSASIISETKYIKVLLKTEDDYTHNMKTLKVSIDRAVDKEIELVNYGPETATSGITWFSYPLHNVTYGNDVANTNTYEGDNSSVVTSVGYVILPPNYSRSGKPFPVVIHAHGTGGVVWNKSNAPSLAYHEDWLKFIAKNGFIVIGCCTTTELYAGQYRDADVATPLTYSAYVSLFRYIAACYNADVNRVSIYGYSGGGIMSQMLARLQPFKINCCANFAGSLDYAMNGRVLSPTSADVNILGNTLNGIPTENQPSYFSSRGMNGIMDDFMIERFKTYKDNVCGLSPMFYGLVGVEIDDMMDELYSVNCTTAALDANQDLQALVAQGKIICTVPVKIWHAIDDENVPYAMSKYYVQMIHRGGGYAKLRTIPANNGQHGCFSVNGPQTNYVTSLGEDVSVPVCFAELVDWFNKWNN